MPGTQKISLRSGKHKTHAVKRSVLMRFPGSLLATAASSLANHETELTLDVDWITSSLLGALLEAHEKGHCLVPPDESLASVQKLAEYTGLPSHALPFGLRRKLENEELMHKHAPVYVATFLNFIEGLPGNRSSVSANMEALWLKDLMWPAQFTAILSEQMKKHGIKARFEAYDPEKEQWIIPPEDSVPNTIRMSASWGQL